MSISVHSKPGSFSPMKAALWTPPASAAETSPRPAQDQLNISQEGRQAQPEEALSELEHVLLNTSQEDLMDQVQNWRDQHPLEVNWNATVDPDGGIYAKAYLDSLVSQYDGTRRAVEAYYAPGHQENLGFANPYNHLVEKYRYSGSPYFRGDMDAAQRAMAFEQERALLWGGRVKLNDPWALAASGGVLSGEEVEAAARQAAQEKLNTLIAAHKQRLGLEE